MFSLILGLCDATLMPVLLSTNGKVLYAQVDFGNL